MDKQLNDYRTMAPEVEIVKTWKCRRDWELIFIDVATVSGCTPHEKSTEIYMVEDVDQVIERCQQLYEALKPVIDKN